MSDPEVPQPERPKDVNDVVDSANEGLADAAAAGAEVPGDRDSVEQDSVDQGSVEPTAVDQPAVDPDLAAFEDAEKSHPGTFATPELNQQSESYDDRANADYRADSSATAAGPFGADRADADYRADAETVRSDSIADTAYLPPAADDAETRVVPSEPTVVVAPVTQQQQQPIFVQAPEPPRDRGNRGTAAGIGLLATIVFAILYLGTALGLGALAGDVTVENIGEAALAPLTTWGFWVPIVVFFIGFWLLGAVINRGRWGL
ncbi:ABC transporter, partial [Microbacterium sp.]|uniref:ABC transporter n=1 Tax=Microbacterium sp. TaxID=51671 RepID=UPI002735D6AB